MDDNELDRLFGKDSESDGGIPDDEPKAPDTVSDDSDSDGFELPEESSDDNPFTLDPDDEPAGDIQDDLDDDTDEEESSEEDIIEVEPDDHEYEEPDDDLKEDSNHKEDRHHSAPSKEQRVPAKKTSRRMPEESSKSLSEVIPLSGKSILAVCLALAVVIMVILVAFLPAFRVKNAHIEGNIVLSDQEVLNEVGLEYDAHLMSGVSGNIFDVLRLNYGKTEERVKKENPYIEDIRISIKLPSTVDINIRERSKICYIKTPDGFAALDKDGIVLELSSFDSKGKVGPVICGLNVRSAELGKPVIISNTYDYKKAIIVLGAILAADNASVGGHYSMFENTSEVRILPSGYIFLTIYSPSGNLIQIKLDSLETISDDMAWLLYLFNSEGLDKVSVDGALDMTDDDPIFREY